MRGNLTRKEKRFLDAYLETNNLAESAKRAGLRCPSVSAYSHAGRTLLNGLQATMREVLEMEGLSDQLLAQKIHEGLYATRKLYFAYEGKVKDEREIDDYAVRAKYVEHLGRLKGAFIDKVEHSGKDGGDIVLQLSPRVPQRGSTTKKELEFDE